MFNIDGESEHSGVKVIDKSKQVGEGYTGSEQPEQVTWHSHTIEIT